jgi:hypothetical protein
LQAQDWQVIVKEYGPLVWRTAYRLLASRTEDELSRTRQQFVQLLVSCQPEDLGPASRPLQNLNERNEP